MTDVSRKRNKRKSLRTEQWTRPPLGTSSQLPERGCLTRCPFEEELSSWFCREIVHWIKEYISILDHILCLIQPNKLILQCDRNPECEKIAHSCVVMNLELTLMNFNTIQMKTDHLSRAVLLTGENLAGQLKNKMCDCRWPSLLSQICGTCFPTVRNVK